LHDLLSAEIATVPNDPDRYGPWAGKIIIGDNDQAGIYAISPDGAVQFNPIGIQPQDLVIIPVQENLYAITATNREIWHAKASEFAGMTGDLLIAEKQTGILWRVRWAGSGFKSTKIAQAGDWQ
jgi:hypothetical protein